MKEGVGELAARGVETGVKPMSVSTARQIYCEGRVGRGQYIAAVEQARSSMSDAWGTTAEQDASDYRTQDDQHSSILQDLPADLGGFPDDLKRLKDEVRFIESIVKHWPPSQSSKWRSAAMRMYVNAMRERLMLRDYLPEALTGGGEGTMHTIEIPLNLPSGL